ILWNYYVTDVDIVAKRNTILLYNLLSVQEPLELPKPAMIVSWYEAFNLRNLYPDKMRNMNECPLYISTNQIKYPLTEKKIPLDLIKKSIVKLLRDIMNFTPIVSVKEYISIDSCATARARTPPITPGRGWWKLLSPLNGYFWLILLPNHYFFVKSLPFAMKIQPIKRLSSKYLRNATKLRGTEFITWGMMVGQPVRLAPKRFRDFYIIGLWLWFTFDVRSAYQSGLIGALKTEPIEDNYANLREAIRAGYKIGGRSGIYSHYEYDPVIKENFEVIPEVDFYNLFRDVL
ncbi:putative ionotropic receptor IR7d, partial [Operophtera brumata]